MGTPPPRPPVRSAVNKTVDIDQVCDYQGCVPVNATLTNVTLRVGPSDTQTQPFDVFVYLPRQPSSSLHHDDVGDAGASGRGGAPKQLLPIFVYNGEGFYSGIDFGDLTAQGLAVLLSRGYAVANFNRNQLRIDSKTGPSGER